MHASDVLAKNPLSIRVLKGETGNRAGKPSTGNTLPARRLQGRKKVEKSAHASNSIL